MAIPYALLQVLFVPLAFTPIAYVVGRRTGKQTGWVVSLPLLYTLILLLSVAYGISNGGSLTENYAWASIGGLNFGLKADGLSIWIAITINLLCLVVAVYSIRYMEHRFHEEGHEVAPSDYASYYALYLFYAVGMLGTVLATNLIEFYLFYELMLIPSWVLINNYGYGARERIGLMYFLWTHVGAVFLLVGILSSYWITGSFEISALSAVAASPVASWIAFAILIGFFVKMAVFGLHIWLPYAHAEAPTPISALLSPAMIGIGAYAAARLVVIPMNSVFSQFSLVFSLWALITIVYGGLMALAQDDVKRFLAYSSVSQMGYIFLGLSSATSFGITGAMFQYVSHGLGKCILFLVAGILITQVETRSIKKLGGLADRMPLTGALFLIGVLSIAGVPPTIGFMSKWIIFSGVFTGALEPYSLSMLAIAVVALVMTVITVGYTFWMARRIFFGPLPEELKDAKEAPPIMTVPLLVLAVLSLIIGIYPQLVTDYLFPFVGGLISP
jgi:NADH-quinone oxidoreductase subunit M